MLTSHPHPARVGAPAPGPRPALWPRPLGRLAVAGVLVWRDRPPRARPNVLLVTIDTLRADRLGCYGARDATTPVLDALAGRGVRFETAVAAVPLTGPSHATILSGLTPVHHGVRDNGAYVLPDAVPTLAEAFRAAGYRTAGFVSGFPVDRRFGFARGFDHYDDRLPHGTTRAAGRTSSVGRTGRPPPRGSGSRAAVGREGASPGSPGCTTSTRTGPTTPLRPGRPASRAPLRRRGGVRRRAARGPPAGARGERAASRGPWSS